MIEEVFVVAELILPPLRFAVCGKRSVRDAEEGMPRVGVQRSPGSIIRGLILMSTVLALQSLSFTSLTSMSESVELFRLTSSGCEGRSKPRELSGSLSSTMVPSLVCLLEARASRRVAASVGTFGMTEGRGCPRNDDRGEAAVDCELSPLCTRR